jgi:hypothetical protein
LEPVFLTVPGSIAAYDELTKGTYDVLTASIDNTIGRYLNGIDSARVIGGIIDGAGVALWARPEIKSPKDLLVCTPVTGHGCSGSQGKLISGSFVIHILVMLRSLSAFLFASAGQEGRC